MDTQETYTNYSYPEKKFNSLKWLRESRAFGYQLFTYINGQSHKVITLRVKNEKS